MEERLSAGIQTHSEAKRREDATLILEARAFWGRKGPGNRSGSRRIHHLPVVKN